MAPSGEMISITHRPRGLDECVAHGAECNSSYRQGNSPRHRSRPPPRRHRPLSRGKQNIANGTPAARQPCLRTPNPPPPREPLWACCTSFPLQQAWVGEDHPPGGEGGDRESPVSPDGNNHLPLEKYRGAIQISKFNAGRRDCPAGDRPTSPSVNQPQGTPLISPGTGGEHGQGNRGTTFQREDLDDLGELLIGAFAFNK
ncbi:hypothetical protein B0I37DRAFT_184181 [Chaetomium sp. MPI-CAGE-AT-0009]|nr:hypothetical protein B0I37DRAFT_184181 [Chaetomium sp. MPI-CAGE-AT-0009]